VFAFLKDALSDGGQPSMSRCLTCGTVAVACVGFLHVVWYTGKIPDALTMGGLAAFAVAPYTINQARGAIGDFHEGAPSKANQNSPEAPRP
jgi:hypothetical protein